MRAFATAAALLVLGHAAAAELAGVHLEPSLRIAGQPLVLVSCGVRDTLWIDVYVAGVYVPPGTSTQVMRDASRPKAVRLKVVEARYLPEEIPEKWRGTLQQELAQEPMTEVRRAYARLADGDTVTFAYAPGDGVSMSVNGRRVAHSAGHRLIDTILDAWAEKDSVSGKLHRLRLEHPC